MQFLVSAGEASGDLYASGVIRYLQASLPGTDFYGCAGPRLQALGVRPVVDASALAVVGLAEVVSHLPRIYGEFRKLIRYAEQNRPVATLLTDSPDFHLRVAQRLKRLGVPVFYLVAPQVWAWRQGRVAQISRVVDHLYCLFPFEERWFRERGVNATYIGHPLERTVRVSAVRADFFSTHGLDPARQTIALLPGSRQGELARHLPVVLLRSKLPLNVLLATPRGFGSSQVLLKFREPIKSLAIQVVEGQTWDCIGHADLALAASGTVTMECAILGTPMVTYYRVMPLSWIAGRRLVKVPFLSMVNLIAQRQIVPELMQNDFTAERLAREATVLLTDDSIRNRMRAELGDVRRQLAVPDDPFERVASDICQSSLLRPREPVTI